jgi:RNA polymerase sigma-70 factor (ECF subfamily)
VKDDKTKRSGDTRELLELLRNGNQEAFKEIYLHYADSVFLFLKLLTRSGEDAKEITQEVFIQLWEKRDQVNATKSIKGYLYIAAKHAAMNFFEHRKVHAKYALFAHRTWGEAAPSPEDLFMAREVAALIESVILGMPAQRQRVFLLSREEGLSMEEIATRLQISKCTVESHLSTAKRDIRDMLSLEAPEVLWLAGTKSTWE